MLMRKTILLWVSGALGMAAVILFVVARRERQPSPESHFQAAATLARGGDVNALTTLVSALSDGDAKVRVEAATTLGQVGKAAVPSLLKALREGNADARAAAIGAMERIGDRRAVEELARLARSEPYVAVRAQAVTALGRLGGETAREALADALKDSDAGVRLRAVEALGRADGAQSVQAIAQALSDPDESVRKKVEEVLQGIGTAEARAALQSKRP